jgi:hypothetical protein
MINQIDHIVEHLFNKKKLDEVSENELEEFIAAHPYFAGGHFLLAKKTQLTRPEQTKEKIAKAALYYNNALWFQWLLDQKLAKSKIENGTGFDSGLTTNGNLQPEGITSTTIIDTINDRVKDENEPDKIDDELTGPVVDNSTEWKDPVDDTTTDEHTNFQYENVENYSTEQFNQDYSTTDKQTESTNEDEIPFRREQPDSPAQGNSLLEGEINHESRPEESSEISPESDSNSNAETSIEESINDTESGFTPSPADPQEEAESKASEENIGKTLSAALIPAKGEIDKNDFVFEPYHTIDYFASQGIKLQQSDLSKDKFGKQLKSFTEWLRSMKRLPQASVDVNIDEATQQTIQKVAEHSIEEKEIVTETMAEVWIKQGNREKAIETLHKLSLLNPSKSHYFAAKIEQLKAL